MSSEPTNSLDLAPYLLLKSGKINTIGFFHTETGNKGCRRGNFECGASDTSSQKSTFLQINLPLNPHSATCIPMNPRYVQQRDDTEIGGRLG